jgi:hypothetical protein
LKWLKDLYQENRLVGGSVELSGRRVDLKSITAPVLNVCALGDHIIPPDCSRALGAKIGRPDHAEIRCPPTSRVETSWKSISAEQHIDRRYALACQRIQPSNRIGLFLVGQGTRYSASRILAHPTRFERVTFAFGGHTRLA